MKTLYPRITVCMLALIVLLTACPGGDNVLPPNPPEYSVSISPSDPCISPGDTVTFKAVVGSGTAPYTYEWTFDDSSIPAASGKEPMVAFTNKGVVVATVTVTDADGETVSDEVNVRVKDDCSDPVASIDQPADGTTVQVGQSVSFAGSATGGDPPYAYLWLFTAPAGATTSSNGENVNTQFPAEGEWIVTLIVTDNAGDEDETEIKVNVEAPSGGGSGISMSITGIDGLSVTGAFFAGLAGPQGWIMGYGQDGIAAIDFGTGSAVRVFFESMAFLSGLMLSPPSGLLPAKNGEAVPTAARYAFFGYGSGGAQINYWEPTVDGFGITLILFGGVSDAAPYGDDATSGGFVYTKPTSVVAMEYDAAGEFLSGGYSISSGRFPGLTGNLMSSFARDTASSVVVVTDSSPAQLYLAPGPFVDATLIGEVGSGARQIRYADGICVISCFDSDSLWVATWDDLDNVSIVGGVPVGDGPIGIDLLALGNGDVAVVSTGFNDNTYSITVFGPTGALVSNVTQPVPTGCLNPPHAVWVPGTTREVLFSCNGSDNAFIVPSGL